MPTISTRQRLTQAALELFLDQGVGATTTRQIADRAGVNEVTLFRNFGNKYGLLLAMLQDAPAVLAEPVALPPSRSSEALRAYASDCLHTLDRVASFVRSVVGEADQYPPEHRQALQQRLGEVKQDMAQHLAGLLNQKGSRLTSDELASFLGAVLVGYTVVETTSGYALWDNREDFLDALVLVLIDEPDQAQDAEPITVELAADAIASDNTDETTDDDAEWDSPTPSLPSSFIVDLPTTWVHQLLKQARSLGHQDYALALVLFGAGLLPEEVVRLERSHQICDKTQHILQITASSSPRQVPVNQWILGKRYGSYTNNPLTKWLKTRKDEATAMFVTDAGTPMTTTDIHQRWDLWCESLSLGSTRLYPTQARQTWCVEMLMRGMTLENLSILAGSDIADLAVYAQRAKEKDAIASATQLDRKGATTAD